MIKDRQLIFAGFLGACAMAVLELASSDWRARAAGGEEERCRDEPDRVAYFARKPGEAHTVEACIKVRHIGDPAWVPTLGDPTVYGQGLKGKPGLEQQLAWVRIECRKRAKQLNQRC